MKSKTVLTHLDKALKPLGFNRRETTWNRKTNSFIDVIDVQVSNSKEVITINVGVLYPDVYRKCWENEPAKFIEEPSCTVRARIGQLIDGKDLWWQLDESGIADDIANKVAVYGLPFLEQMHSPTAMEQFLTDSQVIKQKYPLPIIYLAILKHEQGDVTGACTLLRELQKKTVGAWQDRIAQVIETLSC